jgi:hypothetical protein
MDEVPDFTDMSPKDRLRFWAMLSAKQAKARAEFARLSAEMEAIALHMGVEMIEVIDDTIRWTGRPTEVVLAERPDFDDGGFEYDDDTWPVNIEKDLLAKLRAAGVDLADLLLAHAEARNDREDDVLATVERLRTSDWVAVLTVGEAMLGIEATYVFSMDRGS